MKRCQNGERAFWISNEASENCGKFWREEEDHIKGSEEYRFVKWGRPAHSSSLLAQYAHLRSLILGGYWNHETTSFSELEYMETANLNNLDPNYDFHLEFSHFKPQDKIQILEIHLAPTEVPRNA